MNKEKHYNMKTRTIKVWDGDYAIEVASIEELAPIAPHKFPIEDDTIGFYVSQEAFDNMSDEELEEYVNREGYDWKGPKPGENVVYVVRYTLVVDSIHEAEETHVFATLESAKELFNKLVAQDKEEGGWDYDESRPNYYESWADCYIANYCHIELAVCKVQ